MRDSITKDLGWKLFSLLLAGIIWYPIWQLLEGDDTKTTRNLFTSPELQSQSFTNVAVSAFKVNPDTVNVRVSGSLEDMTALGKSEIHAIVNLTDFEKSHELRKPVNVSVPLGIKVVRIIPPEVDVVIPKSKDSEPKP
jgi:YbbR-like protein